MALSEVSFHETQGYDQGFFSCVSDPTLCLATFCFPYAVAGKVKGDLDGTGFDIWACLCAGLSAYRVRRRVQQMFNIQESEDSSMVAIGLCGMCAMIQDAHELEKRGYVSLLGHPAGAGGGAGRPGDQTEGQQMQGTQQMGYVAPSSTQPGYASQSSAQAGYGPPSGGQMGYGSKNGGQAGYGPPSGGQMGYGQPGGGNGVQQPPPAQMM